MQRLLRPTQVCPPRCCIVWARAPIPPDTAASYKICSKFESSPCQRHRHHEAYKAVRPSLVSLERESSKFQRPSACLSLHNQCDMQWTSFPIPRPTMIRASQAVVVACRRSCLLFPSQITRRFRGRDMFLSVANRATLHHVSSGSGSEACCCHASRWGWRIPLKQVASRYIASALPPKCSLSWSSAAVPVRSQAWSARRHSAQHQRSSTAKRHGTPRLSVSAWCKEGSSIPPTVHGIFLA